MALSTSQQFSEIIRQAKHILITTSTFDKGDALSAALAFEHFLSSLSKPADIIISSPHVGRFNFLAHHHKIKPSITSLKKLIISLNTKKNKINEFNYDTEDDKLNIYITPQNSELSAEDIEIKSSDFKYDLIICLGSPDLESLGDIYQKNSDFFYKTPIINIDTNPANEHFGSLNIVNINNSSVSETVYEIIQSLNHSQIDSNIATCLLCGLMSGTKNFRSPRVTPNTLAVAANLIKLGGDREKIVTGLNQYKNISTLNLWGRALARLKEDHHYKLAWTMLSQTDFAKSGATPDQLNGLVEDIISNSPLIDTVVILYETASGQISGIIHTPPALNALRLTNTWYPQGSSTQAAFDLATTRLIEAENEVINSVRRQINP